MKIKILLLGGGFQCLSAAHSLKTVGFEVIAFLVRGTEAQFSRFIDLKVYPPCNVQSSDYLQFLLSYLRHTPCSVIIPMTDKHAAFLSHYKQQIESASSAICAVTSEPLFSQASNKGKLMEFCRQHGFPHPRTFLLDKDNLEDSAAYVGFPALIKPDNSVGARGITLVRNVDELKRMFRPISAQFGSCSLQAYIQTNLGTPYYNVMIYRNREGVILNSVVIEILRYYPLRGGSSSLCHTIDSPELVHLCTEVLNAMNWHGFADFDVLKDENGDYNIIEINPRLPASVRAAEVAGVNFPEIIVKDSLRLIVNTSKPQLDIFLRYLGLDLLWFFQSPYRFKTQPSWFKFLGNRIYYQEGGWTDYKAMFFSLFLGMKKVFSFSFRQSKKGMNR